MTADSRHPLRDEEKEIREEVTENTEMAENKESVEETVETIDPCEVLKKEKDNFIKSKHITLANLNILQHFGRLLLSF